MGDDNLLGVRVHHEVGIVCDENNLSMFLRLTEIGRKVREYRLVVEIFLRLVDDERPALVLHHRQIQDQQDYALGSGGQFFQRRLLIHEAVVEADVLDLMEPSEEIGIGAVLLQEAAVPLGARPDLFQE